MGQPSGHQVYRLQIVNADDDVVARFAGGGRVEADLVADITAAVRATWLPPAEACAATLLSRIRYRFGLTTRKEVERHAQIVMRSEQPTDDAIASAVASAIIKLKRQSSRALSERF